MTDLERVLSLDLKNLSEEDKSWLHELREQAMVLMGLVHIIDKKEKIK